MQPETFKIRRAGPDDAAAIQYVHREAIYGKAASHYDAAILAAWARAGTPESIAMEAARLTDQKVLTFVAEQDAKVIGFATLNPAHQEIGAVYVAPGAWRGVGARLLETLESAAAELGLSHLACDSSLNAEKFYAKRGYEIVEYAMHRLQSGIDIPCVMMKKQLAP